MEEKDKAGFHELFVVEELEPEKVFEWNYAEAANPVHPLHLTAPPIDERVLSLLGKWDSAWDSVWDSAWDSMWDSVWAYVGSLFVAVVKEWKYIKHEKGEYPFQSAADLWRMGLVPCFDGQTWRLHGGPEGKVLWEGKLLELANGS